jgi:predicted transcriptional regulator
MSGDSNVLVVTVDDEATPYENGLAAIDRLERGEPVERPATIRFATETQLTDVFNERTYRLLRVIRDDRPASIREPARLVGRDKKNVHAELTPLEAVGAVRSESEGAVKRPVLPYDDLESSRTDRIGVPDAEGAVSIGPSFCFVW